MNKNINTKKVIFNTGIYGFVAIMPTFSNFLLLPFYSRYLSTNEFGIIALLATFNAIFATFISFQLDSSLAVYYFELTENEIKKYFSTILITVTFLSILFLFIFYIFGSEIVNFIFSKGKIEFYPLFVILIFKIFFQQIVFVTQKLFVVKEEAYKLLIRSVIGSVVEIVVGIILVAKLKIGVAGAISASALGVISNAFLNIYLIRRYLIFNWEKKYFFHGLKYSLPLIPHAIGGYLFLYSDILIMEKFLSLSLIGIYSVGSKFAMLLKTIVNSFNKALMPNFMKLANINVRLAVNEFQEIIINWTLLISIIYLFIAFFSEECLKIMTPENYHSAYGIIPILLIAYIFRGLYCFASYPLFFLKKTKYIPIITFSAGLINVFLNIILIPKIGIYGAAWTTVLAFFITFYLSYIASKRYFKINFDWIKIIKIVMPIIILIICIYLLKDIKAINKLIIKVLFITIYLYYLWLLNFNGTRLILKKIIIKVKEKVSGIRQKITL